VPLPGAVSAAAGRFLRHHPRGQAQLATLARPHGNAKALARLAPQRGRAV